MHNLAMVTRLDYNIYLRLTMHPQPDWRGLPRPCQVLCDALVAPPVLLPDAPEGEAAPLPLHHHATPLPFHRHVPSSCNRLHICYNSSHWFNPQSEPIRRQETNRSSNEEVPLSSGRLALDCHVVRCRGGPRWSPQPRPRQRAGSGSHGQDLEKNKKIESRNILNTVQKSRPCILLL